MSIIDYDPHQRRYTFGDIFEDVFAGINYLSPWRYSYTFSGQIVDTSRYDIVPKREFIEGEITRKEEELRRVEEIHKITLKQKQDEIDSLRKKLTNK